jgi:uncharacterized membrane protein YqaE (UPF0057 family)
MYYIIAILFPPLAVLMSGRILGTLLNIVLTLCFYFPGLIHAWIVVTQEKNAAVNAINKASKRELDAQKTANVAKLKSMEQQSTADAQSINKQIDIIDSKSKNDGINENDNSDEESIETKMDSLKSMLDKELITEDEYNEKKKVLLDKL